MNTKVIYHFNEDIDRSNQHGVKLLNFTIQQKRTLNQSINQLSKNIQKL